MDGLRTTAYLNSRRGTLPAVCGQEQLVILEAVHPSPLSYDRHLKGRGSACGMAFVGVVRTF